MKRREEPRLTLSQLKALPEKSSLVEADKKIDVNSFALAFQDFINDNDLARCQSYAVIAKLDIFQNGFVKSHCPPIRYIGKGSERVVYACDGRTCFKVDMDKTVSQNKIEAKVLNNAQKFGLMCFPELVACSKDLRVLEVECCATIYRAQLQNMLRMTLEELIAIVSDAVVEDGDYDAVVHHIKHMSWPNKEKMLSLVMKMKSHTNVQACVLDDLVKYQMKFGQFVDIDHIDNWGIAIRDGKEVVLPIDVGM